MMGIGFTELLILILIPVAGLVAVAAVAILYFVIRAAVRAGNRNDATRS